MSAHLSDELPRLLTGEADHDTAAAASAHLRSCPDCQQDLVAAVVAHAALTSAHRFAPEVVRREIVARPQVNEVLGSDDLPDLSAMFAQVRTEASTSTTRQRGIARPSGRALLAAAAAVIVIGGGTTGAVVLAGSGSSSGTQHVALAAFDRGTVGASASFRSDHLTVNASSLPKLDSEQRYEVWLTNDSRTQMQPVGWLDNSGEATMTVPSNLAAGYRDIEVSVQQLSTPGYDYSGTSVLRGQYAA